MIQGKYNAFAYTVSDNSVYVLCVFPPFWFLLVEFNSIIDLF